VIPSQTLLGTKPFLLNAGLPRNGSHGSLPPSAEAPLGWCEPHFEHAGKQVAATRKVAGTPMCDKCFDGKPVKAAEIRFGKWTKVIRGLQSEIQSLREEVEGLRVQQEEALKVIHADVGPVTRKPRPLDFVDARVADEYKIEIGEMYMRSNAQQYVVPRQIAMYLRRKLGTASLPAIGRRFHRHHTTVCHAIMAVETMLERDQRVRDLVARVAAEYEEMRKK